MLWFGFRGPLEQRGTRPASLAQYFSMNAGAPYDNPLTAVSGDPTVSERVRFHLSNQLKLPAESLRGRLPHLTSCYVALILWKSGNSPLFLRHTSVEEGLATDSMVARRWPVVYDSRTVCFLPSNFARTVVLGMIVKGPLPALTVG